MWRTDTLFWESRNPAYTPMFTIKSSPLEKAGIIYPSLRELYMEYNDPTEYQFASEVLGGWEHWEAVSTTAQLAPRVLKWRDELEVKMRSGAILAIYASSRDDGSKGVAAAKYIADRGWEKVRGRPSNEELLKEKKIRSAIAEEVGEDADRLGLH